MTHEGGPRRPELGPRTSQTRAEANWHWQHHCNAPLGIARSTHTTAPLTPPPTQLCSFPPDLAIRAPVWWCVPAFASPAPSAAMDVSREASHMQAAPSTGTTIVACTFKGGVVLGADGRVSVGNYISNRFVEEASVGSRGKRGGEAAAAASCKRGRIRSSRAHPHGRTGAENCRASNKIAALADYVFLLRSGSAPDTQIISDHGAPCTGDGDRGGAQAVRLGGAQAGCARPACLRRTECPFPSC